MFNVRRALFPLILIDRAVGLLSLRQSAQLGAAFVVLGTVATELNAHGHLSAARPEVQEHADPVLVEVGTTVIRVSDARAQAVMSPDVNGADLPTDALFDHGLVEEAADQVALANRAEEAGLHNALEIRAELALARRRILSSAWLDLAVQQYAGEAEVRAAYDRMVAEAASDQTITLRRILVSSRDEAVDAQRLIGRGTPFADVARRRSLDMETRNDGGRVGSVRVSELPVDFAEAAKALPIGDVSDPIEGEQGWYLISIDARKSVRMPPYAAVREQIAAQLRDEAVRVAVAEARAAVPIRLALSSGTVPPLRVTATELAANW